MEKKLSNLKATIDNELFNNTQHEEEIKSKIRNKLRSKDKDVSLIKKRPKLLLNILSYTLLAALLLGIATFTWQEMIITDGKSSNSIKSADINENTSTKENVEISVLDVKISNNMAKKFKNVEVPVITYVVKLQINDYNPKEPKQLVSVLSAGKNLEPYMKENEQLYNDIPDNLSNLEKISGGVHVEEGEASNETIMELEYNYIIKNKDSINSAIKNAGDVTVTVYNQNIKTNSLNILDEINLKHQNITMVNKEETVKQRDLRFKFKIDDLSIKTKIVKSNPEDINVLEYKFTLKDIGEQKYEWSIDDENKMIVGIWAKKSLLTNMVEDYPIRELVDASNMKVFSSEHKPGHERGSVHNVSFQFIIKDGISPERALKEAYNSNILIYIGGQFIQSNGLGHYIK